MLSNTNFGNEMQGHEQTVCVFRAQCNTSQKPQKQPRRLRSNTLAILLAAETGVDPVPRCPGGVYCNCNTGSAAADLVKWTSALCPPLDPRDKQRGWVWGFCGGPGHGLWCGPPNSQIDFFVCLFLYLKILSNVFVLGIKSHKLLPTLFLEECSDSNGKRLEISRGVRSEWSVDQGSGPLGFPNGFWGRWPSRSLAQCSLLRKFTPTPFTYLCHGISIGLEHLLLPEAAANVETNTRFLSPTPGF